jgi:hypothetical protein
MKPKICPMCEKEFTPSSGSHIYCGSERKKTGCSYKRSFLRMAEHKERAKLNPEEYKRKSRDHYIYSTYRMRLKDKERMVSYQSNKCLICGDEFETMGDAHIDHCHKSGEIRGALCGKCNRGIGMFGDDVSKLKAAINYLGSDDNPYEVVEQFELAIAKYTGAPFAIAVNSATNALLLACAYNKVKEVTIPKHTYTSVPMSIIHAGGTVKFGGQERWQEIGMYGLFPYPIIDSARHLTSDMYRNWHRDEFVCISLHWGKTLNLGQGGVILHSDPEAQEWFKKARFDGRTPGVHPKDDTPILGWHCYMSPRDAADALTRLHFLPKHNDPLPIEPNYPDLSKLDIWKK